MGLRERILRRARELISKHGLGKEQALRRAKAEVRSDRVADDPEAAREEDRRRTFERAKRVASMGPPVDATLRPVERTDGPGLMAMATGGGRRDRREGDEDDDRDGGGLEEMAMIGLSFGTDDGDRGAGDDDDDDPAPILNFGNGGDR